MATAPLIQILGKDDLNQSCLELLLLLQKEVKNIRYW